MFTVLRTASTSIRIGVGLGLLLTAIPAGLLVFMLITVITEPPPNASGWVFPTLAMLIAALFASVGLVATILVANRNPAGCVIFYRPAYFLGAASIVPLCTALFSLGGDAHVRLTSFLLGLGMLAFSSVVVSFYRWLVQSIMADELAATTAPLPTPPQQRQLPPDSQELLREVIEQACLIGSGVATGTTAEDQGTQQLIEIAGGSEPVLSEATRILTNAARQERNRYEHILSVHAAHLTERAWRRTALGTPRETTDGG